jgi:hypothetical protein
MSGHSDGNVTWVLVEPDVVAKVEDERVTGLLVYGDITAARLRSITVGRLDIVALRPQTRVWRGPTPPTRAQLARRTKAPAADLQVSVTIEASGTVGGTSDDLGDYIRANAVRVDGESAQEFYARFADVVEKVSVSVKRPNAAIAEALDLDPNTVKQYVHRCRALGFLPPTRRSAR